MCHLAKDYNSSQAGQRSYYVFQLLTRAMKHFETERIRSFEKDVAFVPLVATP